MAGTYNPLARASFTSLASPNDLALLADGHGVISRKGTVASGIGVLKRGQICKVVPATGVITVGATAAEANCVLADDIDATSATVEALVYLTGRMKADAIRWPGALAHADVTEALRDVGIYIESVLGFQGATLKSVPSADESSEALRRLELARAAKKREEKEQPLREEEDKPKPSDSLLPYLTDKEREESLDLVDLGQTLAAVEDQKEEPKKTTHNAPPPPPKK